MGRSIPSFRYLLEIERTDWNDFKELLCSKTDKRLFNTIFENSRLYTGYLGYNYNPIPLESIIMSCLYHNYKILLEYDKQFCDVKNSEEAIEREIKDLVTSESNKKTLFDKLSKKWEGFLYSVHQEDRIVLKRMFLDACNYLNSKCALLNVKKSTTSVDYTFLLVLLIMQNKMIDAIDKETKRNRSKTLLDYI